MRLGSGRRRWPRPDRRRAAPAADPAASPPAPSVRTGTPASRLGLCPTRPGRWRPATGPVGARGRDRSAPAPTGHGPLARSRSPVGGGAGPVGRTGRRRTDVPSAGGLRRAVGALSGRGAADRARRPVRCRRGRHPRRRVSIPGRVVPLRVAGGRDVVGRPVGGTATRASPPGRPPCADRHEHGLLGRTGSSAAGSPAAGLLGRLAVGRPPPVRRSTPSPSSSRRSLMTLRGRKCSRCWRSTQRSRSTSCS